MLSTPQRSIVVKGLAYGAGLAALWVVMAAFRPETTFHLAPLLVAGTPPVVTSLEDRRLPLRSVLVSAVIGLVLALAATAVVSAAGWMEGPALEPFTDARIESIVLAGAGAGIGLGFGWWRGRA